MSHKAAHECASILVLQLKSSSFMSLTNVFADFILFFLFIIFIIR
jgi:hypothetical protein